MADAGGKREPRYSAFISYNWGDARIAARLQRRLEAYRLPRQAAAAAGGPRLRPVFRDRDEMGAAPDLTAAVRRAIRRSEHLLVVCTARAAKSEWVGREVAYFRSVHGDRRILAAVFDGDDDAMFHPALLTARDGAAIRPLAADFRRGGDGRLAFLKLVAALAHVDLDELVRRDARRRARRMVLAAVLALAAALAAAVLVTMAVRARAAAQAEEARTAQAVDFQLKELRDRLKAAGRLDLLAALNEGVARMYAGRDPRTMTPAALIGKAQLFQAQAEDDEKRGRMEAARRDVLAAYRITAPLLGARRDDAAVIFAHAQSEYWVGFTDWRMGRPDRAAASFRRYADLADRLVAREPGNTDWRLERGYAYSNLGALALRARRDVVGAKGAFETAQREFEVASKARPADLNVLHDVADGEGWLADTARIAGDAASALANRRRQRMILEGMLARQPRDARYRAGLVANGIGLARLAAGDGNFAEALVRLEEAGRLASDLAASDQGNAAVARQVRVIEVFRAQTWLAMPAGSAPKPTDISAAIGDCDAEWRKPRNTELATFCTLTAAQVSVMLGDHVTTNAMLRTLGDEATIRSGELSEYWRLDLTALAKKVGLEVSGVPRRTTTVQKGDHQSKERQ